MRIGQVPLLILTVFVYIIVFSFVYKNPNKNGLFALLILWAVTMAIDSHYTAKSIELIKRKQENIDLALLCYREEIERPPHHIEDNQIERWLISKFGTRHALYTLRPLQFLFFVAIPLTFGLILWDFSQLLIGAVFVVLSLYSGFILKQSWTIMSDIEELNEVLKKKRYNQ